MLAHYAALGNSWFAMPEASSLKCRCCADAGPLVTDHCQCDPVVQEYSALYNLTPSSLVTCEPTAFSALNPKIFCLITFLVVYWLALARLRESRCELQHICSCTDSKDGLWSYLHCRKRESLLWVAISQPRRGSQPGYQPRRRGHHRPLNGPFPSQHCHKVVRLHKTCLKVLGAFCLLCPRIRGPVPQDV